MAGRRGQRGKAVPILRALAAGSWNSQRRQSPVLDSGSRCPTRQGARRDATLSRPSRHDQGRGRRAEGATEAAKEEQRTERRARNLIWQDRREREGKRKRTRKE